MAYSFDAPQAGDRRKTQYFEIGGNRAVYHDGWLAGTVHKAPWEAKPRHPLTEDVWELYHVDQDFSMSDNLAAANPEKLRELQLLFTEEAIGHHVLPIDDRTIERFDPKIAGRPDLMDGRTKLTVYPGMVYMSENAFINVKNASLDLVADVEVTAKRNHGVLLAQGGRFGGWSLWVDHGRPMYSYNFLGLELFQVAASEVLSDGEHEVKMSFDYDAAKGRGAGGRVSLYIDGKKVGEGIVGKTHANIFSLDDTADTGVDTGTPVDEAYGEGQENAFRGVLEKVRVEVR